MAAGQKVSIEGMPNADPWPLGEAVNKDVTLVLKSLGCELKGKVWYIAQNRMSGFVTWHRPGVKDKQTIDGKVDIFVRRGKVTLD